MYVKACVILLLLLLLLLLLFCLLFDVLLGFDEADSFRGFISLARQPFFFVVV